MDKDQHGRVRNFDPWRFAVDAQSLDGRLALSELSRVAEMLSATDGAVEFALRGSTDTDRHRLIELRLHCEPPLEMPCRRCLQNTSIAVETTTCFELVTNEQAMASVGAAREPLLAEPLALATLIEDEILLALPQEPKHESLEDCGALAEPLGEPHPDTAAPTRQHPFAGLSDLLKD